MIEIDIAQTLKELDDVRSLMREFVQWARELSPTDREKVDKYFDEIAFESELASLPGKFGSPEGCLLVGRHDGVAVGCVALRKLDDRFCEMKRMFVQPKAHGLGIGRSLAQRILAVAKAAGYAGIRLDTSCNQTAAMGLYESLGFQRVPAYYAIPDDFHGWLVFYERRL